MSHKRAKKLRQLGFHAEFGSNWPAAGESRQQMLAMKPTSRELRQLKQYNEFKINKRLAAEYRFNISTHQGRSCSCPPEKWGRRPCEIWLNSDEDQ